MGKRFVVNPCCWKYYLIYWGSIGKYSEIMFIYRHVCAFCSNEQTFLTVLAIARKPIFCIFLKTMYLNNFSLNHSTHKIFTQRFVKGFLVMCKIGVSIRNLKVHAQGKGWICINTEGLPIRL